MKHRFFPFFLFLFPVFIILYLYSRNITEVEFVDILRSIVVLLILFFGFYFLVNLFVRDRLNSSIIVFSVFSLFLVYGHVHDFLKVHPIFTINLGHHSVIGVVWLLLMVLIPVLLITRKRSISPVFGTYLNLVLLVLTLLTVFRITSVVLARRVPDISATKRVDEAQNNWLIDVAHPLEIPEDQYLPDIYYIIPDMFARSDVLADYTGYDNSQFIEALQGLGFYVADCSRSNYASTQLSIASSLNGHYLDQIQSGMTDRGMLREPMSNSLARFSLESIGYKIIVFNNEFGLPELENPDLLLSQPQGFFLFRKYSPFENLIVYGSFLRIGYDVDLGILSDFYDNLFFPYREYVGAQEYILSTLPEVVDLDGPKFIYAHIMTPHPPYLFREDGTIETNSDYYREKLGQPVTQELFVEGYKRQVIFIEGQLLEVAKKIIDRSKNPPIIIIQGDHGIDGSNRMDILNAYYVPEDVAVNLYATITPVNTFRIIFNSLFGTDYALLPDQSWYSVYPDWFEIALVNDTNPQCRIK